GNMDFRQITEARCFTPLIADLPRNLNPSFQQFARLVGLVSSGMDIRQVVERVAKPLKVTYLLGKCDPLVEELLRPIRVPLLEIAQTKTVQRVALRLRIAVFPRQRDLQLEQRD